MIRASRLCPAVRTTHLSLHRPLLAATTRLLVPGPRQTSPVSTTRPGIPPAPTAPPLPPPPLAQRRSRLQAYLALTRFRAPAGTILLFLPCAQSLLLAASLFPTPPSSVLGLTLLFGTGALVMRSSGCIINDLWDRNLDRQVARTATRPIASGEIGVPESFVVLGSLLSLGLGVLTQLNLYSILLGASSLSLVILYPLMKRVTYLPQLVLGLAFNWGALLGYPALLGHQDLAVVGPLYVAGICWTLIYDTIYAHQDIRDDEKVGIKSTARLFGESTKPVLSCLAAAQFSSLAYLGVTADLGLGFWAGSACGLAYTARMLYHLDIHDVENCGDWFRRSQVVGWLIVAGLAVEYARTLVSRDAQRDATKKKNYKSLSSD